MNLTVEEFMICREYSDRSKDGKTHCKECPMMMNDHILLCKANCSEEEWEEYDAYQKHKGIHE